MLDTKAQSDFSATLNILKHNTEDANSHDYRNTRL
jgi:hypothetical protein